MYVCILSASNLNLNLNMKLKLRKQCTIKLSRRQAAGLGGEGEIGFFIDRFEILDLKTF